MRGRQQQALVRGADVPSPVIPSCEWVLEQTFSCPGSVWFSGVHRSARGKSHQARWVCVINQICPMAMQLGCAGRSTYTADTAPFRFPACINSVFSSHLHLICLTRECCILLQR